MLMLNVKSKILVSCH